MTEYETKLNSLVNQAIATGNCSSAETIKQIVMTLEDTNTPIGGLLFNLDRSNFMSVIHTFVEFRKSGRFENFNRIHAEARNRFLRATDVE